MKFGLEKCKTIHVHRGKVNEKIEEIYPGIEPMRIEDRYKYLGMKQGLTLDHSQIKKNITREFEHRVRAIPKTQLNGKNTTRAVNTFAIPVLTYTFGVIKWSNTDLESLQRKLRTSFTKYGAHHPNASVERTVISRAKGGLGMLSIKDLCKKQILSLRKYFYEKQSPLHQAIARVDRKYTPLNLADENYVIDVEDLDEIEQMWAGKEIHGRHYREITSEYVDRIASNKWLDQGVLFRETEAFVVAIQDRVIPTRNYQKYIMKIPDIKDVCRRCGDSSETIEHIISGCRILAEREYLRRHNNVAKIIHQELAIKHHLFKNRTPNFLYSPYAVLESDRIKITWDRSVLTDKRIPANRPDIIFTNKVNNETYIIDIAVPNASNIIKTYNEKIGKYQELAEEIKKMWGQRNVYIVPIVLSATGIIPKNLFRSLDTLDLPGNIYIRMQKEVILQTSHITRKFMSQQ